MTLNQRTPFWRLTAWVALVAAVGGCRVTKPWCGTCPGVDPNEGVVQQVANQKWTHHKFRVPASPAMVPCPPCWGYHPTCWRRWDGNCPTCPTPIISEVVPEVAPPEHVPAPEAGRERPDLEPPMPERSGSFDAPPLPDDTDAPKPVDAPKPAPVPEPDSPPNLQPPPNPRQPAPADDDAKPEPAPTPDSAAAPEPAPMPEPAPELKEAPRPDEGAWLEEGEGNRIDFRHEATLVNHYDFFAPDDPWERLPDVTTLSVSAHYDFSPPLAGWNDYDRTDSTSLAAEMSGRRWIRRLFQVD